MAAFDILIVGAGTCGLETATALAQKGHRVRLLEESGTLNDFGGSITFLPNATRIFAAWGLREEFEKYVTPIRCFASKDGQTGEVLGHTPCSIGNIVQIDFDGEYWNIHRADYQSLLAKVAAKYNVEIVFGAKLKWIDTDGVCAFCSDGRSFRADVIIEADGLASVTRKQIPAISDIPINEWPEHCYRCVVPKDNIYGNPRLEPLLDPAKIDGTSYTLEGKYVLTWPMSPERQFEMLACVVEKANDTPPGRWDIGAEPREVQGSFSDCCYEITENLKDADSIMKWNMGDLPALETWRSPNGCVVVAGDAAHTMIPHAASGPSSAIEDAAVLAETLTWASEHGRSVCDATKVYEQIRKPRVTRLQEISRQHYGFLNASGEAVKHRNAALRELDKQMWETLKIPEERRKIPKPEPDPTAPFQAQWLYGYDAIQDAQKQLSQLT